eukprot:403357828
MINQTPLNNIDDQNQNKFQDNDLFKLKFQEIDQNQQFYINNQQNQLLQLESSNTANFGEDFTFSRQSDYDQYYYGSNGNQEKLQKNQQQEDLEVSAFDDGNNHLNLMIDQCKNENTQQKDSVCEEQVYEKKMFEKKYDQSRQLKLNQILKQNGSNQCQQDFNVQNQRHTQPFTFDQVQSQELIDKIQKLSNNTVISEYYFNSKKVLQNLKRSQRWTDQETEQICIEKYQNDKNQNGVGLR